MFILSQPFLFHGCTVIVTCLIIIIIIIIYPKIKFYHIFV
jgi:hypothetical protein